MYKIAPLNKQHKLISQYHSLKWSWAVSLISHSQEIVPRSIQWSGHSGDEVNFDSCWGQKLVVQSLTSLRPTQNGLMWQSVKLMPCSHYVNCNNFDDNILIHCKWNSTYFLYSVICINIEEKIFYSVHMLPAYVCVLGHFHAIIVFTYVQRWQVWHMKDKNINYFIALREKGGNLQKGCRKGWKWANDKDNGSHLNFSELSH
jgi:hypothetical protein